MAARSTGAVANVPRRPGGERFPAAPFPYPLKARAIAAGTPVLVSDASGLGLLLRETLGVDEAESFVVETRGDAHDADRWSHAIQTVLQDREAAFRRAAHLRARMAADFTWSRAATRLLAELGPATR